MKKKIIIILLILGLSAFLYFQRSGKFDTFAKETLYTSYCVEPIYYKEGLIDKRFGLTKSDVIKASEEASEIWNKAVGFNVFEYNSEADLTINMIYDQRQSLDTQIRNLESDLKSGKTTLDEEVESYENEVAQFESRKAQFQSKIDDWNANRGGSQEEYDALLREQDSLANEADRLNILAEQLNISAYSYNTQVNQVNQTIDTFNEVLEEKPEEGLYDPFNDEIDIYFNNDRDKLIRTIAHELGHARGLGHTNDSNDLMYPITTSILNASDKDLELLHEICEPYFIFDPYIENFKYNIQAFKKDLLN